MAEQKEPFEESIVLKVDNSSSEDDIKYFIHHAMRIAIFEEKDMYYAGEIPGFEGVSSYGDTRLESWIDLESALGDWIHVRLCDRLAIPCLTISIKQSFASSINTESCTIDSTIHVSDNEKDVDIPKTSSRNKLENLCFFLVVLVSCLFLY